MKTIPVLTAALEYAKLGWRVFPILAVSQTGGCECGDTDCGRAGKHPAIKGWNKVATTDLDQIKEWWGEHPDRGLGIATGEASGLTVLDVDGEEGVESLSLLAKGVGMPPTPCVQSRPGRYHYYFAYEEGVKSNAGKIGAKLDARGNDGYVVAPPSRHASGGVYTWLQHPSKVPLSPWPDFLKGKAAATDAKKRGRPAKETFSPANPKELAKLKDALTYVDPDDEERWGQVGWILGRAFRQSDAGFAIYSAWAARSRKYDAKRTRGHYYERSKEIRGGDLKTVASIWLWAQEEGWTQEEELEERSIHIFENPCNEHITVQQFISAAAVAPRIFVMDRRLVRIMRYGSVGVDDASVDRDPTAFVMWDHDADTLAVEFGLIAGYWSKLENGGHKRSSFNRRAIQTFMAMREYHTDDAVIKPLDAFVPHPTLRADGSLITEVGYDAASRLFLTSQVAGLKVDRTLDAKAAGKAMQALLAPFSEYPWATPADRAVFAAALFTVGLRHLFDIAPLFAFSSPKHGSGKTQLAECISRLWYGITLSKATWTPNPEEMEKRIAAFLLAGDRMVCLDNVTEGQRLEDSTLNKVLTSRKNTFRILGKTERVELTNEATWFATGNQLLLSGDISRRSLMCYVDAKVRDPGSRSFTIANLPRHIMEHRAELMSFALSIAASWMASGRPTKPSTREYGSFTMWYTIVRPMLMWAGEDDIAKAIDAVSEEDSEAAALEAFANALRSAFPPDSSRLTITEIMKLFGKSEQLRPTFAGCLPGHAYSEPNHRNLADLMRRVENKVFVSDNPGHQFVINKRRNVGNNTWVWGIEYLEK